jgi:hypothetical protein
MTTTAPAPSATWTASAVVDAYLDQLSEGVLGSSGLLADDARFSATVPQWRYQVRGADAVRQELGSWFACPTRIVEERRVPTAEGEVVVLGLRWEEHGGTWGGHQTHVLTVADGRITAIHAACGGRWSPEVLAQLPASADAV